MTPHARHIVNKAHLMHKAPLLDTCSPKAIAQDVLLVVFDVHEILRFCASL